MNKSKFLVCLLFVAVVMLLAPASHAQGNNCQAAGSGINCNVMAVGSSAIFPSAALAAVNGDPQRNPGNQTPLCGTRFWTGSAFGRDPRNALTTPNIVDEPGTVWIAWDNDTSPAIICTYLSVDSIVGQRLFFAQGSGPSSAFNNGTLILNSTTSPGCPGPGANKVVFVWDTATAGLPSAIYNALQGTTGTSCLPPLSPVNFTTASTDVAPADAKFVGNDRVLAADGNATADLLTDNKSALGYGGATCTHTGPAVQSSYETSTIANSVCYTFVAATPDPISGTNIPNSQVVTEGALAMLPIVNIKNSASGNGGFGDLFFNHAFNDVLSADIAAGYVKSPYGSAVYTRDLLLNSNSVNGQAIPFQLVHYLAREPQSGTYTTWEWQVIRNKESALGGGAMSQETNVCGPTQAGCYKVTVTNPVDCPTQATFLSTHIIPPSTTCSNYMSWGIIAFGNNYNGLKTRVLGTGEMVKVANDDASGGGGPGCTIANFGTNLSQCLEDQFGYAFWSLGTFGGKGNIRYLQLDSNDSLYQGWKSVDGGNNGLFPTTDSNQNKTGHPNGLNIPGGTLGCAGYFNGNGGTIQNFLCNAWPYPTFANIVTGNYRVWSFNRVMWFVSAAGGTLNPSYATATLNAPGFWLSAADQTAPVIAGHGLLPDFMPFGYCANGAACPEAAPPTLTYPMNAFRTHYTLPAWGVGAANGINGAGFGQAESGGDVAGTRVTVQAEADSVAVWGASFLAWIQ